MIQQLQDEISRLRRGNVLVNGTDNNDNNMSNVLRDNTVSELREQLHKAASHVRQLARDKRVLIEVGNRLRAELLRNGNIATILILLLFFLLLWRHFQKSLRLLHFKSDRDDIWHGCSSNKYASIDRVIVFNMTYFQDGSHDVRLPLTAGSGLWGGGTENFFLIFK